MDETPLVAEGTDSTVSIAGDKVVVRRRGVKTLLQRGLALYRDPRSLARAFEGPSRKVVTAALVENKELAKVIVGAVKGPGSAEDAGSVGKALTDALKQNRQALVDALRANDTLVKSWLRDHKDLAGIVLKGDVHVFVADITSLALTTARDGRRVLVLTVDGQQLTVPYDPSHDEQFRRLCAALAERAGAPASAVPLPPPPPGSDAAAAAAAAASAAAAPATKACPMCAEDVKAAAVICRFCGYRFDEPQ